MSPWSLAALRCMALAGLAACFAACGGGSGGGSATAAPTPGTPTVPATPTTPNPNAQVQVLMMGNSHTVVNGLPDTLARMLRGGTSARTVNAVAAPGFMFLDERFNDPASLDLLRGQSHATCGTHRFKHIRNQPL